MPTNTGNNQNRDKSNESQKGMGREQEQRQAGRKEAKQAAKRMRTRPSVRALRLTASRAGATSRNDVDRESPAQAGLCGKS